jgi:hypothetical protein
MGGLMRRHTGTRKRRLTMSGINLNEVEKGSGALIERIVNALKSVLVMILI